MRDCPYHLWHQPHNQTSIIIIMIVNDDDGDSNDDHHFINPHQNDRLAGSTQLDGGGRADGEGELRCQPDV